MRRVVRPSYREPPARETLGLLLDLLTAPPVAIAITVIVAVICYLSGG